MRFGRILRWLQTERFDLEGWSLSIPLAGKSACGLLNSREGVLPTVENGRDLTRPHSCNPPAMESRRYHSAALIGTEWMWTGNSAQQALFPVV